MKKILCLVLVVLFLFCGCGKQVEEDLGSFVKTKTESYDKEYNVSLNAYMKDGEQMTVLDIRRAGSDYIYTFIQAGKTADFQGYCWENNSHNIWVQTADKGVTCYSLENGEWKENKAVEKPDYIITKGE